MGEGQVLVLTPIGIIHSPYKTVDQAPRQGSGSDEICQVEVFEAFQEGLRDIEMFSHLILVYWFHLSVGYSLSVTPRWDVRPHGLFTSRSPRRPNPLGLCVVELLGREGNALKVRGLDAIDGTPLLDIKPYFPRVDERCSV
jgi:tRNA-Thr(GGU) m(6)t(6)A37 methyltransferase TsaA